MIKKYLKQSWHYLCTEKLYSALYIGGVAISIAAVMVLSIVLYSKLAPVYPEYRRPDIMYVNAIQIRNYSGFTSSSISEWTISNIIDSMKTVDSYTYAASLSKKFYISGNNEGYADMMRVGPGFFRMFEFDFEEGAPYTDEEIESGTMKVVVSDRFAEKEFGSPAEALGKELIVNQKEVRVAGVVRAASDYSDYSSDIYVPYKLFESWKRGDGRFMAGDFDVMIIPRKGVTRKEMQDEMRSLTEPVEKQYADIEMDVNFLDQPVPHSEKAFRGWLGRDAEKVHYLGYYLIVALVMMMVPAMNLSGMIVGRMEHRRHEMGLRKAFGARRGGLIRQVLVENLLLTCIGAAIGLLIAWVICYTMSDMVFTLLVNGDQVLSDRHPSMSELFSPAVFCMAFGFTLILNVLSSYIPAWWSLRHPIVKSLNEKR